MRSKRRSRRLRLTGTCGWWPTKARRSSRCSKASRAALRDPTMPDPSLLGSQVLGILVTIAFVGVADLVLGFVIKALFRGSLRVSEEKEAAGLDVAEHGESAYPAYIGLD
ncbi:ammonium transporter [Raoultibacter timonensis]|uniref:ammonium transporter n=1 Tax=Raoultibacter timonensis TaxID=1907662 RepID=UPI000C849681